MVSNKVGLIILFNFYTKYKPYYRLTNLYICCPHFEHVWEYLKNLDLII